jgi:hypothetical protein
VDGQVAHRFEAASRNRCNLDCASYGRAADLEPANPFSSDELAKVTGGERWGSTDRPDRFSANTK